MNVKDIFFIGSNIIYLKEPYKIEFIEFIKPGKGHKFIRTKIRNWINNKLITKTFKFFSKIRKADIRIDDYIYIYNYKNNWYFLNKYNYSQIWLPENLIKDYILWIYKDNIYNIVFWNKKPIRIILPENITLKVIEVDINKNNNSLSNLKYVKLITGIKIKVPNFINVGDIIKINSKFYSYKSRIK